MLDPGRFTDKKLAAISEQIMSAPDCLKHSPHLMIRMRKVIIVDEKTTIMMVINSGWQMLRERANGVHRKVRVFYDRKDPQHTLFCRETRYCRDLRAF